MYLISGSVLLLLASTCFCHHIHILENDHFGIYGGTAINITEVPFMALYRAKNQLYGCGAAIVTDQFLVTAGHCVIKINNRVTVGTDKASEGGTDYEIKNVFRHPKWFRNLTMLDYDIAVIKLKDKITFNDRVQPLKLADSSMTLNNGDKLQTIGFGQTEKGGASNQLLSVKLPYVDVEKCQQMYKLTGSHITKRFICAGGEAGRGSCYGDSGSPIFYKDHLYGVTSWGKPCSLKDYPTVYSSVTAMRDFIDGVMKNNP